MSSFIHLNKLLDAKELTVNNIKANLKINPIAAYLLYSAWLNQYGDKNLKQIDLRYKRATKGPWEVKDTNDGVYIYSEKNMIIAELNEYFRDYASFIARSRTDLPNARLIQFILQLQYSAIQEKQRLPHPLVDVSKHIEHFQTFYNVEPKKMFINNSRQAGVAGVYVHDNNKELFIAEVYRKKDADFILYALHDMLSVLEKLVLLQKQLTNLIRQAE
ncbi:hypothetical protein [Lihuaxuella thermophila]|nr:hypothetical protein [Lihuaxuella thermophila]